MRQNHHIFLYLFFKIVSKIKEIFKKNRQTYSHVEKKRNLTQVELSKRVAIDRSSLRRIEIGKVTPRGFKLFK